MVCIVAADKEGLKASAPAQLPPARLLGDQLRGRHHPDPQREVPHRRQGQHRVQPVPGAALPRLGGRSRSRRTAAARTTSTSSSRSTSSSPASTRTAGRCRRSSSRNASTTTSAALGRRMAALPPALLAHALRQCARSGARSRLALRRRSAARADRPFGAVQGRVAACASSLTHLSVRSLRCSAAPCPERPGRAARSLHVTARLAQGQSNGPPNAGSGRPPEASVVAGAPTSDAG